MEEMDRLLEIMRRLRDPDGGCPWDREQTFRTIAPYTLEEAYEVADAIEREDMDGLRDELGDLLFQVVFHARMAEEGGHFDFSDVTRGLADKMRRRHPHVFGDATVRDAAAQTRAWEAHKARERAEKGTPGGLLDDVPATLPALVRAQKLGRRASRVGFDWPGVDGVLEKLDEEIAELRDALQDRDTRPERAEEELGDVLFTLANLARHMDVDAESALRRAGLKFQQRFGAMEREASAAGRDLAGLDAGALERLWDSAKDEPDS
ncbi:MAG: nucleoside triphosphate pyrophosphohydrolase [Gammaproteobacteria bacterium]